MSITSTRPLAMMVGLMVVLAATAAWAAEPDEAAESVDFRGYYIEDGAAVSFEELESVAAEFSDRDFAFVALAADPAEGADLFAEEVRQISGARTVIVVSDGELGYVSDEFDDAELDAAADEAIDSFDRSYADGFRRFASALVAVAVARAGIEPPGTGSATTAAASDGAITTPTVAPDASSGSGGGLFVFFLIIAAIIGFFIWMSRRSKQKRTAAYNERVDELKAEIRAEMSEAANEILDLEDKVRVSDDDRAQDLYAAGAKGYADFQEKLDAASTFEDLHDLGNEFDQIQWQLEAAEAIVEGREVPPEPTPEPMPAPDTAEAAPRPDLPPELDLRQDRRQPMPPPRPRGGGALGSLGKVGSIAIILRELQRAGGRSSTTSRSRRGSSSGRGRSTGVQVPRFPGSSSTGSRSSGQRSNSRSTSRSSGRSSGSKPRGRGRRKR
jgi:hypothetical protein